MTKNTKPRHFADWKCVDRTLRHMVPQGWGTKECAAAAGITPAQVTRRSRELGIPITEAFGPESRCRAGHRLKAVGFISVASPRTGRIGRRCNVCFERYKANGTKARRIRRGSKPRKVAPVVVSVIDEANRVARINRLIDEEWRASTSWERRAIQQQINELQRKRVTA